MSTASSEPYGKNASSASWPSLAGLYAQFTSVADQAAAAALETLFFAVAARDGRAIGPQTPSPDKEQAGSETRPDQLLTSVEVSGLEPPTSTLRT